jgi:hypothetical protein
MGVGGKKAKQNNRGTDDDDLDTLWSLSYCRRYVVSKEGVNARDVRWNEWSWKRPLPSFACKRNEAGEASAAGGGGGSLQMTRRLLGGCVQ